MTEPQLGGTYDQLLALARWSESNGMASFARSDHYYSGRSPRPAATDALATLAGLARETSSIRLAVLVTPITFRHPAVIAKNAATIDEMSGGRLDLGVGTGWMEAEHTAFGLPFPPWSERFSRLEEALGYLEAAFGDGRYTGEHYRFDAEARPTPSGIRLIVGGSGERRTPRLAGTHADEYNQFFDAPPELARRISVMRQAAGDRPVTISVMGGTVTGRTDAEYQENLARVADARGKSAQQFETELKADGVPVGTPGQIAEAVARLEEVGVDRWYVQWLDLADPDGFYRTMEAIRGG